MSRLVDLTGKRFGTLEVIKMNGKNNKRTKWLCKCDCGKETTVEGANLKNGNTKSCGCLWKQTIKKLITKHELIHTRLYKIWAGMKGRCTQEKRPDYNRYGGRGITYCAEWEDFLGFYNWAIANGYDDSLSLDRKDNSGNYCPENCKWSTAVEQCNNRRSNTFITIDGETKTIADWSRYSGKNYNTIISRMKKGICGRALIS